MSKETKCRCDKFFVAKGIHDPDCKEHPVNKKRKVNDMTSDLLQDWFENREREKLQDVINWIQNPLI